jgi:hypothetical protein
MIADNDYGYECVCTNDRVGDDCENSNKFIYQFLFKTNLAFCAF